MANILVIDDMEGIRQAIMNTLENEGHVVSEACNGAEGQVAIEQNDYDLIITDMFMPEKDGFDIMKLLDGPVCHSGFSRLNQ